MKKFLPLSYSSLKQFAISPSHFLAYKKRTFKSTPSMTLGTAVHTLVLEPETFEDRYYVMPDDIRRGTNAFKEHEALAASRGDEVEILKKKDLLPIRAMRDNILDHPKASFLLSRCHTFEQRRAWKFNGLDFHGFVDAEGDDCIVDLKTTQDASMKKFSRSVVDFKYYWQAALYCAATGYSKRFFVIAVENTAPFNVAVYEIGKEFIDVAIAQIIDATNDFKKWDGMPMSYSKDVEMLTPPSWML